LAEVAAAPAPAPNSKSNQTAIAIVGTIVPAESDFQFTETAYEPPKDLQKGDLASLSMNDLLALCIFYDEVVDRFKNERVSKNRGGMPTVAEAFTQIGWNYEAARKMRRRCNPTQKSLPAYAPPPKRLQLCEVLGIRESLHWKSYRLEAASRGNHAMRNLQPSEKAPLPQGPGFDCGDGVPYGCRHYMQTLESNFRSEPSCDSTACAEVVDVEHKIFCQCSRFVSPYAMRRRQKKRDEPMNLFEPEDLIRSQERYMQQHAKPKTKTRAEILCEIATEDPTVTVAELATAAERSQSWVRRTLKAAVGSCSGGRNWGTRSV
jgi:hypothetical protein